MTTMTTIAAAPGNDVITSGGHAVNVTSSKWPPEAEVEFLWLWYVVFTVVLLALIFASFDADDSMVQVRALRRFKVTRRSRSVFEGRFFNANNSTTSTLSQSHRRSESKANGSMVRSQLLRRYEGHQRSRLNLVFGLIYSRRS